eukprot:CAMPEP_0174856236 /NCGR_PEP_ID=MMETSP1114-20130205/35392_1 /TAXON_ID=312471 /ORGANISM="Neobodo designis, Strain CCAP 1951/1" /LENGTH=271 /DNA_ID=CAMNT_0016091023 /DNA_START=122 /DNA_END=937 /DNA_ORIENTATION=+
MSTGPIAAAPDCRAAQPLPFGEWRDQSGALRSSAVLLSHEAFEHVCFDNTRAFLHVSPQHGSQDLASDASVNTGAPAPKQEPLTIFQSKSLPRLSLFELACALRRNCDINDEAELMALVVVKRYCMATAMPPTAHTMHRLFLAAVHVTLKANSDRYFKNATFGRLSGVSPLEVDRLERELLRGTEWRLFVTADEVAEMLRDPVEFMRPLRRLGTLRGRELSASCLSDSWLASSRDESLSPQPRRGNSRTVASCASTASDRSDDATETAVSD